MTRSTGAVREIAIGPVSFRVSDDKPTFWDRVEAGLWEPATLSLLARSLAPGSTFLDLGAWVGPLALYAAALGANVIAVEADPVAARLLRINIAANPHLAPVVRVIERAVAPSSGPVRLGARRKPGDSMSSTLLTDAADTWVADAITPAELADIVDGAASLVVKIDVEGAEYHLLPHLGPVASRADLVVLTLHPDILREGGTADPDGRARQALRPFAAWRALDDDGERTGAPTVAERLELSPLPVDWVLAPPL